MRALSASPRMQAQEALTARRKKGKPAKGGVEGWVQFWGLEWNGTSVLTLFLWPIMGLRSDGPKKNQPPSPARTTLLTDWRGGQQKLCSVDSGEDSKVRFTLLLLDFPQNFYCMRCRTRARKSLWTCVLALRIQTQLYSPLVFSCEGTMPGMRPQSERYGL